MRILFIFALTAIAGIAHGEAQLSPPELWSQFKDLNKSKAACEVQGSFVLDKLQAENRVHNEHGVYAVIKNNRIVIKCLSMAENKSKLMVAVAGYDRDSVELIRNKLIKEIR